MAVGEIGSDRPVREPLVLQSAIQPAEDGEQEEQPWATLVLLLFYLLVLVGLWAAIYMLLLERA
ncbi:MAG: hypothetical protein U0075_03065 [Thermomicrobiales bacterium]